MRLWTLAFLIGNTALPLTQCCQVSWSTVGQVEVNVSDCTHASALAFLDTLGDYDTHKNAERLNLDFSYNGLGEAGYGKLILGLRRIDRSLRALNLNLYGNNLLSHAQIFVTPSSSPDRTSQRRGRQRYFLSSDFRSFDKLEELRLNFSGNPISSFVDFGFLFQGRFQDLQPSYRAFFHVLGVVSPDVKHFSLDVSYTSACTKEQTCVPPWFHAVRWRRDDSFSLETLAIFMSGTPLPNTWRTMWDNYPDYQQRDAYRMQNPAAESLIPRFPKMRELATSFASWRMGDAKLRDFLVSLGQQFPKLDSLTLDLARNSIGDVGVRDIGGALQRLKGLTFADMNLQGNEFSDSTISGLITALPRAVDHVVVQLDSMTFKSPPDETTSTTSSTTMTSSPPPTTHVATVVSTAVASSVDDETIKETANLSTVPPALNAAVTDELTTSLRATTTSPQQHRNQQPKQEETYVGSQLALVFVLGMLVAVGFVWCWTRKNSSERPVAWRPLEHPGPHWIAPPAGPDEGSMAVEAASKREAARAPFFVALTSASDRGAEGPNLEERLTGNRPDSSS